MHARINYEQAPKLESGERLIPLNHKPRFTSRARLTTLIFGLLTLSLLGFLFFNLNRLKRNMDETKRTHDYLLICDEAGDLIRNGSDSLSRSVERYVVSGNLVFRDQYFKEALKDRRREQGLEIVKGVPNGDVLRRNLEEAMRYSMKLMTLEYHAMRLCATDDELAEPDETSAWRDLVLV